MSANAATSTQNNWNTQEASVIDGCDKLTAFQAWSRTKIQPDLWLKNFNDEEKNFALYLLSKFMFFSDPLTDQLFLSSYQNISNIASGSWDDHDQQCAKWNKFIHSSIITIVQGEVPNPSDSGWLFARKARKVLGIDQDNLLLPADALDAIAQGFHGSVVFVDDFVGSGQQFVTSWLRKHRTKSVHNMSFYELSKRGGCKFIYCNGVATTTGLDLIKKHCPEVIVSSGNTIPSSYSWVSPDSILWPENVRERGIRFIEQASMRAGIPDCGGGEGDWRGFNKLGLGLAFEHSVPDATLPLFTFEKNGWQPLVRIS